MVEPIAKKEFVQTKKDEQETVELLQLKGKNRASPFLSNQRTWEDEDQFQIPPEILKGIVEELGFLSPSGIQGAAIPIITRIDDGEYVNLIAQSKNGSGKTGAFTIGTVLRVDPKIPKTQVLVLCHIRELSAQIADVYSKITKFSDITVSDYTATGKAGNAHIVVATLGGLKNALGSRKQVIDLSALRSLVIDEVDVFFKAEEFRQQLFDINNKYLSKIPKFQWVLFSATYPEDIQDAIDTFCKDAYSIALKKEKLQLDHIHQFEYRCEPKKKIDFIMDVFNICSMTQAIIFVNTKKFCETVQHILRKNNYKSTIMFGDMSNEERDEMMGKFRRCEVNVIITTNMLARGIDVPEIEIVINFDVPTLQPVNGVRKGDSESYLHRIGRTGRFGSKGLAVTIYDRDEDKKYLDEIMDHYSMASKLKKLEGPDHLKQLYEDLQQL